MRIRNVVVATVVGGVAWRAAHSASQGASLSADEFNAKQDTASLKQVYSQLKSQCELSGRRVGEPSRSRRQSQEDAARPLPEILLYRLAACPYCAKIEALFRFYHVPFTTVMVDPITASGLPKIPYSLVPQVQFVTNPTGDSVQERGPFVVDSKSIISNLAPALGYESQLTDPAVTDARTWITEKFTSLTFAAMTETYADARLSYDGVVPYYYRNPVFRVFGGAALFFIGKTMVQPKVRRLYYMEPRSSFKELLRLESNSWAQRVADRWDTSATKGAKKGGDKGSHVSISLPSLHGGVKGPDLADIELYGVLQTCVHSKEIAAIVLRSELRGWHLQMETELGAK